jgi:ankyrin repeat protein
MIKNTKIWLLLLLFVTNTHATLLHDAVKLQDKELLTRLLSNCYFLITSKDISGKTALHWAVELGNFELVFDLISACGNQPGGERERERLLKATIGLEDKGGRGTTALHIAASNRNPNIIKLLLSFGADPEALDEDGKTFFDCAYSALFPDKTIEAILEWSIENQQKIKVDKSILDQFMNGEYEQKFAAYGLYTEQSGR